MDATHRRPSVGPPAENAHSALKIIQLQYEARTINIVAQSIPAPKQRRYSRSCAEKAVGGQGSHARADPY